MIDLSHPKSIQNQKVLLSALDWGMGHTTRCVSIIRNLFENGNQVIFAGNKKQCNFLEKEFPALRFEFLNGYEVTLDAGRNTYLQIGKQSLKINRAIKNEHQWLREYLKANRVDLIISDNRYGFYSDKVLSIMMTHQINLQVPYFKYITNRIIKRRIENFDCCWVPDHADQRLTGELSSGKLNIPIHFIGPLCRFKSVEANLKYDYLVILSGPEPERSNFLKHAIAKITALEVTAAFVGENVNEYDSFLSPSTQELELLIGQSDLVFSRAGYTTIMEMVGLGQQAILCPTKGQYEQEYFAQLSYPRITFE